VQKSKEKLMQKKQKGQFTSIAVQRIVKGKKVVSYYCAKIQKITDKTITFLDVNSKKSITTYLSNIV